MARQFNIFIRRRTWRLWINLDLGWRQRFNQDGSHPTWRSAHFMWEDWRKGLKLGPLYVAVVFY